jgi:negative regulator of flagellin synthesis FlgM
MVDSVSSFGGKIRTGATAATAGVAAGAGANGATVAAASQLSRPAGAKSAKSGGDVLSLSANALELPAELKLGPPIDTAQVSKIKQAIAEGKYPVNLDAIKDALFEAWHETIN